MDTKKRYTKRPVSDELEFVCAGLWVNKENEKYQKREAQANARAATKPDQRY